MLPPVHIVILAGGQGTRFWPVSRANHPKQFLSLNSSGESLIQATARRVAPLAKEKNILVMTNVLHRSLSTEHLPAAKIICEPLSRNTAPAIGLAALYVQQQNPDGVMVVLPADHGVNNEQVLQETLSESVQLASSQDVLVTIGVKPTQPHTGYGYIERGECIEGNGYRVKHFYEKPDLERAKEYYQSDSFYWNSGMFVWRAEVLLNAISDHMPDLYQGLMRIKPALGTPQEEEVIAEVFETLEPVSIDYGVMEHASNSAIVAAKPFGWSDVGAWDAWAEHFPKDKAGNVGYGDTLFLAAKDSIVYSKERTIALLGVENLVVIDSGDAVLVCPRDRVQEVKDLVEELKKKGKTELL